MPMNSNDNLIAWLEGEIGRMTDAIDNNFGITDTSEDAAETRERYKKIRDQNQEQLDRMLKNRGQV
ncbi:hypothetical protein [Thalassobaculum litoreum]|uniref:Uncharacterized protein n=1 Tax=Thalassobaculum litoreum DSM 18839 TaxID=1123362 RepID=A0A8G2BMZ5_9PROT|nr:hypothetical protein [Thalassobaculum litoreum]SDG63157.1 hypothetical protein SAMN05660686_05073 [Thalassobaculum litoreum DSM 18839]